MMPHPKLVSCKTIAKRTNRRHIEYQKRVQNRTEQKNVKKMNTIIVVVLHSGCCWWCLRCDYYHQNACAWLSLTFISFYTQFRLFFIQLLEYNLFLLTFLQHFEFFPARFGWFFTVFCVSQKQNLANRKTASKRKISVKLINLRAMANMSQKHKLFSSLFLLNVEEKKMNQISFK